jgi:hypothetical protein
MSSLALGGGAPGEAVDASQLPRPQGDTAPHAAPHAASWSLSHMSWDPFRMVRARDARKRPVAMT